MFGYNKYNKMDYPDGPPAFTLGSCVPFAVLASLALIGFLIWAGVAGFKSIRATQSEVTQTLEEVRLLRKELKDK